MGLYVAEGQALQLRRGDSHACWTQLLDLSSSSPSLNVCSPCLPYSAVLVSRGIRCVYRGDASIMKVNFLKRHFKGI